MKIKCHLCLLINKCVWSSILFQNVLCKSSADESIWEVDDPFLCYYHWFRIYVDTIGVFHPVIWLPAVAASFHCRKWLPVNCSLYMSLASEEESPFWSLIVFRMCIEGELMSQISLREYQNGRHMCCLYIVLCVYQRSMSSFVYSRWSILSLFVQGVIALGGGEADSSIRPSLISFNRPSLYFSSILIKARRVFKFLCWLPSSRVNFVRSKRLSHSLHRPRT